MVLSWAGWGRRFWPWASRLYACRDLGHLWLVAFYILIQTQKSGLPVHSENMDLACFWELGKGGTKSWVFMLGLGNIQAHLFCPLKGHFNNLCQGDLPEFLLRAELCLPPNSHVDILTPRTPECDCLWRWCLDWGVKVKWGNVSSTQSNIVMGTNANGDSILNEGDRCRHLKGHEKQQASQRNNRTQLQDVSAWMS
jgi:hypothetical protein